MHTDPFRAALWCVLFIGTLAFLAHMGEDDRREESTSIEVTTTTATHAVRSPMPSLHRDETPASYVGNVNTHKFHRITCRHAKCPNCTSKFHTRDEAIAAGYRPCGICDP